MIKSRRMGLAGHIARLGEDECIELFGEKNLRKERPL
jgi:hypothetical protein